MSDDLPPVPAPMPAPLETATKVSRFRGMVYSHWRPIGGWVCIISCGYELFILPVLGTILNIFLTQKVELVHVDKVLLIELIGVFVTYRTFEKYHEVDTK